MKVNGIIAEYNPFHNGHRYQLEALRRRLGNVSIVAAMSGSFTVTLDNGETRETILLNHPWQGLLIKPNTWRTLDDFSSGAVCMVLASELFDEEDYIYDYDEFIHYTKCLT